MPSHEENLSMIVVKVRRGKLDVGGAQHCLKTRCSELMLDLRLQAISGRYKNFTRMSPTDFENILGRIGSKIAKQATCCRSPISVQDS
ncbi:hypothetical protein PR048_012217 [Dryococelus australis]|uniref:Uncharacterized protein n=1 Tax=Dryococelus australis TaxID=614101 RepID=A0ABQ9HPG6_9NEOP|nr:hypothetical protein PR048_012217 [Dryococelus australis]